MHHPPHAPAHFVKDHGAYMVTGATLNKTIFFNSPAKLDLITGQLLRTAEEFGWSLQAWAVFGNHYHFVGMSPESGNNLALMIGKLHASTSRELNRMDGESGRRVWYQYWDTPLTFENSYYARLNYVHENPVRHGFANRAELYAWCSAAWFEKGADVDLRRRAARYKTDRVNVRDDF